MTIINSKIISAIASSFKHESKATANAKAKTDSTIQLAVDAARVSINQPMDIALKGNARTNALLAEIKGLFEGLFEQGLLESESAARNYATSFKIALRDNVAFERSLFTQSKGEGKKTGARTNGAVSTTTPEAAEKTARKLIEQLRMLKQDTAAAGIVDVMLEINPEFSETEAAK